MKTKLPLMAFLGLMTAGAVMAGRTDKPVAPANVDVTFVAPEKFSDVRDDYMDSDKGREAMLDQLKEHLVTTGSRYVDSSQRLEIKVTEVDLAGDFEPWRGINFHDVRIVKDIYPPRVHLEFRLLGADGQVISEGKRKLQDLSYLMKISINNQDPLRHDKEMLTDWLRQEFKRSPKKPQSA
jgi:hypothetical protein